MDSEANGPENGSLLAHHTSRFAMVVLVVEAQKMQDPMDEQTPHFIQDPTPVLIRLTFGGRHGDNHIAQQCRRVRGGRPPGWRPRVTSESEAIVFQQRKGENVRWPILFPEPSVQGTHLLIRHQKETKFRFVYAGGAQNRLGHPGHLPDIDADRALAVLKKNRHAISLGGGRASDGRVSHRNADKP